MERKSGVLMHISSLFGEYSIGSFSKEAKIFIDFLKDCNFSYWQVLPFCTTDSYNSPYKSYSAFAGNPYFVDLKTLYDKELITQEELDYARQTSSSRVEYDKLNNSRFKLLYSASKRVKCKDGIENFIEKNYHIKKFCEFMALKDANNGLSWNEWKTDKINDEILFAWKMIQYEFFCQWREIKSYANNKGIKIIGDMPIYVSYDSSDVWSNKELFCLGDDNKPTLVSGVPPDFFSPDGQLWGNPIYNWLEMEKDNYKWWQKRIEHSLHLFDAVRIDHFRGIESYWAVPSASATAKEGAWEKGPGMKLINAIKEIAKDNLIIAEDLGDITEDVEKLVIDSGFPCMRVFQFGYFDENDNLHLPNNYPDNCVAYTGTHDNNTLMGFLNELDEEKRENVLKYCKTRKDNKSVCREIIHLMLDSQANLVIIPIQDLLFLGKEARMNTPGTVKGNWDFRITHGQLKCIDRKYYKRLNNKCRR